MLKSYFRATWRNFVKSKVHSFINVSGLSVGIACSLLILLWVQHEKSIDAYHKNGNRLYKVYEREYYSDHVDGNYETPGLLADELKKVIPEIEDAAMMQDENSETTFKTDKKILKVEGTAAGKSLFSMFTYPLLHGNPETVLSSPSNLVISRKTAMAFFNSPESAMGQVIRLDNKKDYTVTGVFEDLPSTASRRFDYLISWEAKTQDRPWLLSWENTGPMTYVLLRKNADPGLVDKKITRFLDSYKKKQDKAYHVELGLQRFDEAYLHSNFKNGMQAGGRIEYVRLFSIVA